jgi:hypothetical protein
MKNAPAQKALAKYLLWWKEAKTTETILTDEITCARIVDIDEHVFFRMAGKKPRKEFNEVFPSLVIGIEKSVADIKLMRPLAAIESGPETGAVGARLI